MSYDNVLFGKMDQEIGRQVASRGHDFRLIYDVGGSNGAWMNIMSKVWPEARFELFEPLAEIHPKYKEMMIYLEATHANSRMHAFALGEADGTIQMNMYDAPAGSTTLDVPADAGTTAVEVPMRSIDSVIAEGLAGTPDLIKMDIQGGELAALKGAEKTLPDVHFLMLETWVQRAYGRRTPLLHEIIGFLAPLGFVPYDFGDLFRDPNGACSAIDVWFANRRFVKDAHLY